MAADGPDEQLSSETPKHLAPNSSEEHRYWRYEFRRSDIDQDTLRNIFWLINASDHLLGIGKIAVNLTAILDLISDNPGIGDSDLIVFRGWQRVLETPAKRLTIGEDVNPNGNECYKRSPLWSLLWEDIKDPVALRHYQILQGHLLLAHAKYLSNECPNDTDLSRDAYERYDGKLIWPAFPERPYVAAMRIRKLAHIECTKTLTQLKADLSPFEFVKSLRQSTAYEEHLAPVWLKYRRDISSFIAKAHGFEPWSRVLDARAARRSQKTAFHSSPVDPGDSDDEDARWPSARFVSVGKPVTEDELQEHIAADLDPDDFRDAEGHFGAAATDPAAFQQLAIDSAIAVRGHLRHVQMDHQALVWRYKEASMHELKRLMQHTSRRWAELPLPELWQLQEREIAETIAIVQVMLWTGRTLEEAFDLVIVQGREEAEEFGDNSFLYILDTTEWQVEIQPPPYSSQIEAPNDQVHLHVRRLKLQDIAATGTYIEALVRAPDAPQSRSFEQSGATKGCRVFTASLARLEQVVREFLDESDPTGRITIGRVGSALLNQIVAQTGDQMPGALITGRFGPLTRTERFYACYSSESLAETYYQICQWMMAQLTGYLVPQLHQNSNADGYAGARLCARSDAVKCAVERIGKAIDEAKGKKQSKIVRHNLLTLHTVMWFCMATSCRAIRTPYIRLDRVDPDTGFAYLCDKDDDAHHKTRLIWIPSELISQMRKYENHCKHLARTNPLIRAWHEPCFFLKDDGTPMEVRPKTLSAHLQPYLQVPPNFHRKYMRDQLIKAGGGELAAYWLGHAFQGEELWNPHSALSPSAYRESISALLPALLTKLGWKVR